MKKLDGKRVIIAVAHEFEDVELLYPLLRLGEEGARVVVATLSPDRHFHTRPYLREKPVTGRFGTTVPIVVLKDGVRYSHRLLDDLQVSDFDALVFPGGFSPDYLRIDPKTLELTAQTHKAGKLVAAICHGPQVFISVDRHHGTNIVRGRSVTAYKAVQDDLLNAGAEYRDVPAVRSDNVITGRVPDDLPEFCAEIIRYLSE
jgi:protease I